MRDESSNRIERDRICSFKISDVADLMRLSISGVVYLEKKGIITARRQENGYRFYDEDIITRLGAIRSYERLGFPLKDALRLTDMSTEETLKELKEKKQTLLQQIKYIDLLLGKVENAWESASNPENGEIEIVISPAFYYFSYWEKYCDVETMPQKTRRALRKVDVSWLSAMPVVNYCGKFSIYDEGVTFQKGMIVTVDDANRYELTLHPMVEHFTPRRCLHAFFEFCPEQILERLQTYARQAQLKLCAPVLVVLHHTQSSKMGTKDFLSEVWAPFEEEPPR